MADANSSQNSITLPLMPLREVVLFPRSMVPLFVGRVSSIRAIETAMEKFDRQIFLVTQKSNALTRPMDEDLYQVGTVTRILQLLRLPDDTIKVLFEGLYRATWTPDGMVVQPEDIETQIQMARVTKREEFCIPAEDTSELVRSTLETLDEYSKLNKKLTAEIVQAISSNDNCGALADAIVPHLRAEYQKKQEVLEETNTAKRLDMVFELMLREITFSNTDKAVKHRVRNQMERNQREYYLNEQIKAINKEMGREEDPQTEVNDLEKRLKEKNMPEEAREKGLRELKKLRHMMPSSAEYAVVRNYVDWVLDLPWNELKETNIDLPEASRILDEDHFGLDKPKERILEYLAVQKLVNKLKGPILCLVGPPGVGKTSLAKSVARATGRDFVRLSLGGVRDEAEIRGHRRTYVGAMPGKIIQSLRRGKFNNPLFCLDEIDKLSADFRGDPSAALLEVLDPEQNYSFNDHYLDMDYDLSQIFFITTANSLHSIPLPLQDRMEIIKLPGYLETEKRCIAKQFLIPKQLEANGLSDKNLRLSDLAVVDIIRTYTREAGVRNLEREIAAVCRKTAVQIVEGNDFDKVISVTRQNLHNFLGVKKFRYGEREARPLVGACMGLAWTEVGGDTLVVETALMPGTGKVETTGKLGDVMKESARAALSYIRSRSDVFGLRSGFHKEIDIHVHVPEGATPKDGPSAGITLATSMVSALLGIPVSNDIAMTGEITLRGRVLPIGGLREKLLAAHRALLTKIIIPKDNEKDLKDVPAEILKTLTIIPVEHVDEVLPLALEAGPDGIFPGRLDAAAPLFESLKQTTTTPIEAPAHPQ